MGAFGELLRQNRNYRYTWIGQIVSEIGDHFNNIAVFSLVMANTQSGAVVSAVMLSRAIPMLVAGPLAGVSLDRFNRKHLMIASDLVRGVIALGFIFGIDPNRLWVLYLLSGALMFASPFFTSGRSAILPSIATKEELSTANALTQTTQWTTLSAGGLLAGFAVQQFGYEWAFVLNSLSFFISALCIAQLRTQGSWTPKRAAVTEADFLRPWREYREGLRFMKSAPLIFGIAMVNVGWATGGGAAQILFGLFGDVVFKMGSVGIGTIWGSAGVGLVVGGMIAHRLSRTIGFEQYKKTIAICYVVHGLAYVLFSLSQPFWSALLFIAVSRAAVGTSSVLNMGMLLQHVPDAMRGRIFATLETLVWGVMMLSMTAAGAMSSSVSPRIIGVCAGLAASLTAVYWTWANLTGRLPRPESDSLGSEDFEVHGEQVI